MLQTKDPMAGQTDAEKGLIEPEDVAHLRQALHQHRVEAPTSKIDFWMKFSVLLVLFVLVVVSVNQALTLNNRGPVIDHLNCREQLEDASAFAFGELVDRLIPRDAEGNPIEMEPEKVTEAKAKYLGTLRDLEASRDPQSDLYCDEIST